jgi:ketosteroid isomerase-like protein
MRELETTVRKLVGAVDRKDFDVVRRMLTPDAQGIDEISRRWLRGADDIDAYFKELEGAVDEVSSSLSDLRADTWGDVGLVTAWMEQDYTMDGEPQHISAPTTFVLCRIDGSWQVALIHSVPLPDES